MASSNASSAELASGKPAIESETSSASAHHLEADPVGPDELAVMLAELQRLNVEEIVPATGFDPHWPEVATP